MYSIVYGTVLIRNSKSPLKDVLIFSKKSVDVKSYTNENGVGHLALKSGTYTILIEKEGYQSIKLINYEARPDQVAGFKVYLTKGEGERTYDVSLKVEEE